MMLTMRCNVGADWFLPAMFLACALYYLYIRFPGKAVWGAAGTVLYFLLHFAPDGHVWRLLFRGVLGFSFMLAGNLLKKPLSDFSWWKFGGAFLLTAAASAAFLKFSLDNSFYSGALRSPLLYLISGICGTYFVMGIAKWVPWKWPAQIGENALTIMGTHQLIHPWPQQPPLGHWRISAHCRGRGCADPRHKSLLPGAGREEKKGDI